MNESDHEKSLATKLLNEFQKLKKNWNTKDQNHLLSGFIRLCEFSDIAELKSWKTRIHKDLSAEQLKPFEIALQRIHADSIKGRDGYQHDAHDDSSCQPCPLIVVAHNIRSAHNLGSMIRSCEHTGVKRFILSGYTADIDLDKIKKTSMGTEDYIDIECKSDLMESLENFQEDGYEITSIETVKTAPSLYDYAFQAKTLMLFGNERMGLDQAVLDISKTLRIPSYGQKNSLNVAVACGIGLNFYRKCFDAT